MLGSDLRLAKEARLLNRVVGWRSGGSTCEPATRHCALVLTELWLDPEKTNFLVPSGVRESSRPQSGNAMHDNEVP